MTPSELRARWHQRRDEWARLGVQLDGAKLADEVLADLDALERDAQLGTVTLKEAHLIGGYSIDHLQRLVAGGELENVGRKHRPRIRRSDVPIKPGHTAATLPNGASVNQFADRRRIVASVTTTSPKGPRGA